MSSAPAAPVTSSEVAGPLPVRVPDDPIFAAIWEGVKESGLTMPLSSAAVREMSAAVIGTTFLRLNGEKNGLYCSRVVVLMRDRLLGSDPAEVRRLVAEALRAHVAAHSKAPAATSGG